MVVIFQLLVPILIVAQTPFIPESPRWYVKKGKLESARESLSRVRDTEQDVADELLMIREAIEFEKEAISSSYSALWKDPSVRKRFVLALVINAGQQITGQGSLNSYSTKIYQKVFKSASTIALINALNATFGILFTLNATWTVDRFGRRFLFIVGGIGMALCMLVVATVETQTPTLAGGSKSHPVAVAIVFLLFLFIFFYKPSWGATVWIWTSEVFSMNIRAQAVGMASQTQNIANLIVNQFFPTFLTVSPSKSQRTRAYLLRDSNSPRRIVASTPSTCSPASTSCLPSSSTSSSQRQRGSCWKKWTPCSAVPTTWTEVAISWAKQTHTTTNRAVLLPRKCRWSVSRRLGSRRMSKEYLGLYLST
jgi:hypothetical protein